MSHDQPSVCNSGAIVNGALASLSVLLSEQDVKMMASYLHDGQTQAEIAAAIETSQQVISYRIRRAARKLAGAGYPLKLPGRGRRPRPGRTVSLDPRAIESMLMTEGSDGLLHGRHMPASKISTDQNDRLGTGRCRFVPRATN